MDIEGIYKSAIDFHQFISGDDELYKDKILEIYNNINIDDELIQKIELIDRKINILVFAEIWCPDCVINIPALKKICDINDNVSMKIASKEDNEEFLVEYKIAGKIKIPTFLIMDNEFKVIGSFIEIPQKMKEIVANGDQVDIIVAKRKYKKGEYTSETIKDILKQIL